MIDFTYTRATDVASGVRDMPHASELASWLASDLNLLRKRVLFPVRFASDPKQIEH